MKPSRICNICTWFLPGLALLMVLLLPLTAFAGVGGSAVPDIDNAGPLIVGNTYNTTLTLSNASTGEHKTHSVTVTEILFTPSCGKPDGDGRCDCPDDCDTGIFEIVGPIEGTRGACEGCTFTATLVDADRGEYSLTPVESAGCTTPLELEKSLSPDPDKTQCEISFGLKVLKVPEKDSKPEACLQTSQLGVMSLIHKSGDAGEGSGTNSEPFYCETTIDTTPDPSGSVNAETVLHDSATVIAVQHDACTPTGTVTFKLFGPGDSNCTGDPVHTETVDLVDGKADTVVGYSSIATGTYQWIAEYSGDDCNLAAAGECGDEPVEVDFCPTKTVTTPKPASGKLGTQLQDCATVEAASGCSPTGTVTFKLFAPGNPNCTGTAVHEETVDLDGNEACTTIGYEADTTGTYHWTAEYSGDESNLSSASLCDKEPVVINCPTEIVTEPDPEEGEIGTLLYDCATVTAPEGCNPTGTVTFKLFAPSDVECSGEPVHEETVDLDGNQACTATGYPADTVGTYQWTAEYNPDNTDYVSSASFCEEEPVKIKSFEVCRTPGFWKNHACPETCPGDYDAYCGKNSHNITQAAINEGGGSLNICGFSITNTVGTVEEGKGKDMIEITSSDPESALEAMCVTGSDPMLKLIKHLTVTALNCIVSNGSSDCTGVSIGPIFQACNEMCQGGDISAYTVQECIYLLDCWNNGGRAVQIDSAWYCEPAFPSCHEKMLGMCEDGTICTERNTTVTAEGERLCEDGSKCKPGSAGSPKACNSAKKNECTVLDPDACSLNESCQ